MTSTALQLDSKHHDLQLADRLEDYARASKAANTWRGYKSVWSGFTAWCAARSLSALPASPATVAQYLVARADAGAKVSTLGHALAAIASAHDLAGHRLDKADRALATVWAGIRRSKVSKPRQVSALVADDVRQIATGNRLIDLRDRAMLLLGFAAALRRSELSSLTLGHGERGFITIERQGVRVTLLRSKASQEAAVDVVIPSGPATEAIERWLATAGIQEGQPLFVYINKGGRIVGGKPLTDGAVADVVKRRVIELLVRRGVGREEAQRQAAEFSGHSLRVGFVTSAVDAGVQELTIANHTRHASLDMVRRYARERDAWRSSPLAKLGV